MGIGLFRVYDPTPRAELARLLAVRTVPIVVKLVTLGRLPVLRSTVTDLVALLNDLR